MEQNQVPANAAGVAAIAEGRNSLRLTLIQNTTRPSKKKVNGESIVVDVPVRHSMEFTYSGKDRMDSASISSWLIKKLAVYQFIQSNRGAKKGVPGQGGCFDTTLPIEVAISVITYKGDVIEASTGFKMTTSPKQLEGLFSRNKAMLAHAFNPTVTDHISADDRDGQKADELRVQRLLGGQIVVDVAPGVPDEEIADEQEPNILVEDVQPEAPAAVDGKPERMKGEKLKKYMLRLAEWEKEQEAAQIVAEGEQQPELVLNNGQVEAPLM